MDMQTRHHPAETHEQFLQRASRIFSVHASLAWTTFERAVFNQLMASLIFRRSYDEISDAMLVAARDAMDAIVGGHSGAARTDRTDSAPMPPPPASHSGHEQHSQF